MPPLLVIAKQDGNVAKSGNFVKLNQAAQGGQLNCQMYKK